MGKRTPEEEMRAFLIGDDRVSLAMRRVFSRVPSGPNCKLCAAPFSGPGGAVLRHIGFGRYPGNPLLCNFCIKSLQRHGVQGAEIPVGYRIANTPAGGLGKSALPAGKVRIFQESAGSGALFLGEDRSAHLPVGEDATLTVGRSRDVVVTQRRMAQKRINVRRNDKNRVVLYDLEERIAAEVENFKDTPVVLHLRQHIPGQWEMQACSRDYTLEDGATLVFEIPLAPQGREHLEMRYIRRHLR